MFSLCIFYFRQEDPIKVPTFTLSSALVKIFQIPHVIFQKTSHFFIDFCITLQTLYTLHKRNESKCTFLRLSSARVEIFTKFLSFLKQQISVFLQILYHSSVSWDITLTPLFFFSWNFIYFQQNESIKVQIWWNFMWAVENLKFCILMGFFCPNLVQFQLKRYREELSDMTLKSDANFKEKLICNFKHDMKNVVNFHSTTLMGSFCI